MKILFLTNNIMVTRPIYDWLCDIEGSDNVIIYDNTVTKDNMFNQMGKVDYIISYNYNFKIESAVVELFHKKIINLHISLLPWNRGISPNFWSFFDDTPKGVTIHYVDKGIDTGDILVQKQLFFDASTETFASTYKKLHMAIQMLFVENWDRIKNNEIQPQKQCCSHTRKQTSALLSHYDVKWEDNIAETLKKIRAKGDTNSGK